MASMLHDDLWGPVAGRVRILMHPDAREIPEIEEAIISSTREVGSRLGEPSDAEHRLVVLLQSVEWRRNLAMIEDEGRAVCRAGDEKVDVRRVPVHAMQIHAAPLRCLQYRVGARALVPEEQPPIVSHRTHLCVAARLETHVFYRGAVALEASGRSNVFARASQLRADVPHQNHPVLVPAHHPRPGGARGSIESEVAFAGIRRMPRERHRRRPRGALSDIEDVELREV
mmetsp:Transcript_9899/g.24230  ORF Transcript_9899/g.24230 Transcript_9899/m.24230 type:complete len:228 (-) Transcript_9899:424-1107(-)